MADQRDYSDVETIYDALDRGDPETALRLARSGEEDPVLRFLEGVALLELDRAPEAIAPFRRSVELDPDDAEFRSHLALALYHACRLDEAMTHARAALEADRSLPAAQEVYGLLLEALGKLDEADVHFRRAAELDPDNHPAPVRWSREEFETHVAAAGDRLPEMFRRRLGEVAVTVEPVPPAEILTSEEPPLDPGLLGLFVGVPISERSHLSAGGELPPRIYLFQRNLERFALDAEELEEQIAVTLYHELGHYLGLGEDQLDEIDLA